MGYPRKDGIRERENELVGVGIGSRRLDAGNLAGHRSDNAWVDNSDLALVA